ncbi:hypothetical protein [Streptomyces prasinus]|uniref:Recombinase domain-containing protein n=1 Tax=Streptomyces prasinus TaxID=67345 RepID=A0ABX6AYX7_9ACTN|nr:hypothetical protein [Streptomyces prasinus]QEV06867.1 hypothetical protein CP972_15480 [Streptomyces prasinus]
MSTSEIGYRVARRGDVALGAGMLWRIEAESRGRREAGDRPALQEVLFCVRADLVDGVQVDSWEDLGGPITRALVYEEMRACHASLVVGGKSMALDDSLPGVRQDVHDQVRAACAALRRLVPRQEGKHSHLDIGRGLSTNEVVRLAHKLHVGFQLTLPQTAEFLNQAGYYWWGPQGEQSYNKQKVHRLLEGSVWDEDRPRTVDGERIRAGERSHQISLGVFDAVLVYEADSDEDYAARVREVQEIAKRYERGIAVPFSPGTAGFGLMDLLQWMTTSVPIASLYVADSSVFVDELEREVVYAWVQQFGLRVFEADEAVPLIAEERSVIREVVKTYAALRMHDSCTVSESSRSIEHARVWARHLKNEGSFSLEEIARRLRLEAIPTRKRRGGWSRSAVRELLSAEAAS